MATLDRKKHYSTRMPMGAIAQQGDKFFRTSDGKEVDPDTMRLINIEEEEIVVDVPEEIEEIAVADVMDDEPDQEPPPEHTYEPEQESPPEDAEPLDEAMVDINILDYDDCTKREIKAELDKVGIGYARDATKPVLWGLYAGIDGVPPE